MAKKEKKEEQSGDEQSGGNKKLLIIIIAAVVVLLGAGAAGYFLILKKPPVEKTQTEEAQKQTESPLPAPGEETAIGPMVDIKEFIVNIISEDTPHYVKAALSLELNKEESLEEVTKRMPQIRDAILLLIGNKTLEELQDLQGKKQLKAELKNKINAFIQSGRVKNIYLTDFVVQ